MPTIIGTSFYVTKTYFINENFLYNYINTTIIQQNIAEELCSLPASKIYWRAPLNSNGTVYDRVAMVCHNNATVSANTAPVKKRALRWPGVVLAPTLVLYWHSH